MLTYKTALFQVTALTNLHVGSGSQNYGIIDNLVQRDPLTGYPFIYASSLKGALRQYCSEVWGRTDGTLLDIFGRETNDDVKDQASKPGSFRFLDARLLSIPVRSDQVPYFNLTCPKLIDDFLATASQFHVALEKEEIIRNFSKQIGIAKIATHFASCETAILENSDIQATKNTFNLVDIVPLLGEYPALITNDRSKVTASGLDSSYPTDLFKLLTDDYHLPIVARNKVGTGEDDNNLWYEQILPRQTRFFFVLLYPERAADQFAKLKAALANDPIQIGANASVGYGFCQITPIATKPLNSSQSAKKS